MRVMISRSSDAKATKLRNDMKSAVEKLLTKHPQFAKFNITQVLHPQQTGVSGTTEVSLTLTVVLKETRDEKQKKKTKLDSSFAWNKAIQKM